MIPGGAKVIDASGKRVMPGGIDTSVHLQQTFMNASTQDDFYTGTKTQDLCRVDRAPYSGDVAVVANAGRKDSAPSEGDVPMRVTTRPGGIRDLHESSFSLSGTQVDDHLPKRSSARILAPPGGRSSGIW